MRQLLKFNMPRTQFLELCILHALVIVSFVTSRVSNYLKHVDTWSCVWFYWASVSRNLIRTSPCVCHTFTYLMVLLLEVRVVRKYGILCRIAAYGLDLFWIHIFGNGPRLYECLPLDSPEIGTENFAI